MFQEVTIYLQRYPCRKKDPMHYIACIATVSDHQKVMIRAKTLQKKNTLNERNSLNYSMWHEGDTRFKQKQENFTGFLLSAASNTAHPP